MRTGVATVPLVSRKDRELDTIKRIPSEPKIPLKNYLLDLVADSDGKKSSIYLKGVEEFIQGVWREMVQDNSGVLKVRQFVPKKLGVHHMMLYDYKNGKKAISIQMMYRLLALWKTYCQKNNDHIKEKWDEIYQSNFIFSIHKGSSPTKLPKYLYPKLSYLIGFICGDGHLTDYGNHYLLRLCDKSVSQLNRLQYLFHNIFNVKIPLFKIYKGGYALQIGNKAIYRFLTQVLKVRVGEIPNFVKTLDPVNKKYFLIGIFDSEGHVSLPYLDSKIVISQGSSQFLEEIIDLFKDLDIYFTGPHLHKTKLGTWYTIQIRKKSEILKYIIEVGSYHIDKLQKTKLLKEEIYAHRNCHFTA